MRKLISALIIVTLASILLLVLWLTEVMPQRETAVRNHGATFPTRRI